MPIYAYKCESCGHGQDVMQKISDPLLTVCPKCGASSFRKQVTAAGFQLKGSGWYVTDFRGKSASSGGASSGAGASEGGSTSDGSKTETATAAGGACGTSCACH